MAETPQRVKNHVMGKLTADLNPSLLTIYAKSGLSVAVGGGLSLFVCGQFGVSASHSAHHVHGHLIENMEGLACLLLCGALFAILPALMLRMISSPLQFRAITRKSFHAPLLWLVSIGGFLAYHGDEGRGILGFIAWSVAAWITFEGVARILEMVLGRWQRYQLG